MKALRYLNPGILKTEEIDSPHCSAGEALVRVHSAGICGSDMAIFGGKHPRAKPPLVMGHEFAGEIVEIQAGGVETELSIGDKVTAYPLLMCGHCWACRSGVSHVCRDLKLIGIHIGVPWTDEMIAMAWKHKNVFIGIDAYAPKHLPSSLKHYMNSYGSHKVLFGTDWPVIDPERGVREMKDHGFRDGPYEQIMRTNALKVFDFERARRKT